MSTTDPSTPEPAASTGEAEAVAPEAQPEPLIEPGTAEPASAEFADAVEVIEAEVVEEEPVAAFAPPVDYTATSPTAYEAAPPTAPEAPPAYEPAPPQPQVVYVQPLTPPKKAGNRGVGIVWVLLSAVVFAGALAAGTWLLDWVTEGSTSFGFLALAKFWIPVGVFAVAFLLLVLLANRANWWAYILGSVFVAAAVYFGTIGISSLLDMVLRVPAPTTFGQAMVSPFVIVAALIAREVSMWFGSLIARRGRKLKARNAEARAAYEREAAERRALAGY